MPIDDAATHNPVAPVQTPLRIEDAVNALCPWSGKPIAADSLTLYNGAVVGFCNPECRDRFARAVASFEDSLRARRLLRSDVHQ